MNKTKVRHLINYYLPREIIGPLIVVFSAENIIDFFFLWFVPPEYEFLAWCLFLLFSVWLINYWGNVDEDKKELEKMEEEEDAELESI